MPHHPSQLKTSTRTLPNASMSMRFDARTQVRSTEKAVYRYDNDMAENKGNCTWGDGILAHKAI